MGQRAKAQATQQGQHIYYALSLAVSPALSHAFWMMSNLVIHLEALGWYACSFQHSAWVRGIASSRS